ncbi:MAG TPA: aldo/keto reductase [Thermoprotei archaeon]|nr:aldo/keto reductase [Thermoprotei archaeon]
MELMEFGWTGEKISRIGLGLWQISDAWGLTDYNAAKKVIETAYELGVTFYDTAIVYGDGLSEEYLGRVIKELGIRDNIFIASKIPGEYLARDDVYRAVELSRRRLGVDVIDLMQVHWPPLWHNIPTCEYMKVLENLVHHGIVRYIGLSDFPVELIDSARACLGYTDIASIQIRYNLVERDAEKEIIPYAVANDLVIIPWSPLAKGALTGKYTPDNLPEFEDVRRKEPIFHPSNFREVYKLVKVLEEVGEKYGKKPAQIALNWIIAAYPNILPIPGAKNPDQIKVNVGSVGWRLSYEDWFKIDQVSREVIIRRVIL